jgi:hypothetical protein
VVLVPLGSVDVSSLRWLRTLNSPAGFTLYSGDRPVAEVTWASANGSRALATTAEGRWTLKRAGFLLPHLTLRVEGAPNDAARITLHADIRADLARTEVTAGRIGDNYHRVDFVAGPQFRFSRTGVQTPAWRVRTDAGVEVAHIEPLREGRTLTSAAVIVTPEGSGHPELLAVLVFTWYFIVLAWFEDEILAPLERMMSDLERR